MITVHSSIRAVVFDLDDTLIATAHLDLARRQRDVKTVQGNLANLTALPGMNTLLKVLQEQVSLGILTRSPCWYAELLLRQFFPDIRWSAIVTFNDLERQKPYPDGLGRLMRQMGIENPVNLVMVGDSADDVEAAYHARATSALATWFVQDAKGFRLLPDAVLPDLESLKLFLESPGQFLPPLESVQSSRHVTPPKSLTFRTVPLNHPLAGEMEVSVLGRYFARTPGVRHLHDRHVFSQHIARKDEEGEFPFPSAWISVLRALIGHMSKHHLIDVVTVIPAKAGRDPRLERLLSRIQDGLGGAWSGEYRPDLLRFKQGAQRVRQAPPAVRFERAMAGLEVSGQARGLRILVIDDVLTTGATLHAARAKLMQSGALQVIPFVLTATIGERLLTVTPEHERCPLCGGRLMKLTNQRTKRHFLGCTNFRSEGCSYTRSLE